MVDSEVIGLLLVAGGGAVALSGGGNQNETHQDDPGALGPPARGIVGALPFGGGPQPGRSQDAPVNIELEAPDLGTTTFTGPGKVKDKDKDKVTQDGGGGDSSDPIEDVYGVHDLSNDDNYTTEGSSLDVDPAAPTSAFGVKEVNPDGSSKSTGENDGKKTEKDKDKETTQPSEPATGPLSGGMI